MFALLTARRRHTIAAWLLAASIAVPLAAAIAVPLAAAIAVPLIDAHHPEDSLIVRYAGSPWLWLASAVQFAITPLGNVASLVLADRRRLWPKLNYLVLGVWLLFGAAFLALHWMLSHFTG